MQTVQESAFLVSGDKTVDKLGRREPFAVFLLSVLDEWPRFGHTAEEELLVVERYHDARQPFPLNNFGWPCKELTPILPCGIIGKNTISMNVDNVVDSSLVVGIDRLAVEGHDIRLVRREIHVLDTTLSLYLVVKLNGAAILCF